MAWSQAPVLLLLALLCSSVWPTIAKFEFRIEGYQHALTSSATSVSSAVTRSSSSFANKVAGGARAAASFRLPFVKAGSTKSNDSQEPFWKKWKPEPEPIEQPNSFRMPTAGAVQKFVDKRLQIANETRTTYEENPEIAQSAKELLKPERLPAISLLSWIFGALLDIAGFLEEDPDEVIIRRQDRMAQRETKRAERVAREAIEERKKSKQQPSVKKSKTKRVTKRLPDTQFEEYQELILDKLEEIRAKLLVVWDNAQSKFDVWWENVREDVSDWWFSATSEGGLLHQSTWLRNPYSILMESPSASQCGVGIGIGMIGWPVIWSLGAASVGAGGVAYLVAEVNHLLASQGGRTWLESKVGDDAIDLTDKILGKVRDGVRRGIKSAGADILFSLEEELAEKDIEYPSNVVRGVLMGVVLGAISGA